MRQTELVISALAASDGAPYSPVQLQKMLFLLDRNIADWIDGPVFNFEPYSYGPFDSDVYDTAEKLELEGLVSISRPNIGYKSYRTTPAGQRRGQQLLGEVDERVAQYIRKISEWVQNLGFRELVSAIYKYYPDMKVNSIFKG